MYSCDCDDCNSSILDGSDESSKVFEDVLKAGEKAFKHLLKNGGYKAEDIVQQPYQNLINETTKVFKTVVQDNVISPVLRSALESDAFLFGGLKTHAQLFEANSLLINEKGYIKSQAELEHELNKLNVTYNNNYLEAERQFAVSSAISADKWSKVSDRYNLQYRTVNDDKVRDEHRVLHDIVLPVDDDFWKQYYPPNGWRCRCVAVQVRKSKYPVSDSAKAIEAGDKATSQIGKDGRNRLEIFRFNPGTSLKLMPPEHPYNKVAGASVAKEIVSNMPAVNLNELIKKDLPTNAEIKNVLGKYAELFPDDFRNGLNQVKVQKSRSYMMQHSMAYSPSTGEWSGGSTITLSSNTFSIGGKAFNPLEELRGAFGAIKKGSELTFNQEYAVESLWHEILHAKTKTKPFRLSSFQVQNMETINQFVARHTYSDFIARLGGKAYHKAEILDRGYGYSRWVTDFRNELKKREIPEEKAVEFFTPHLMKEYSSLGTKIREFFNQQQ